MRLPTAFPTLLDRPGLQALVDELAAAPEIWQPHVPVATDGGRHYASLHRDAHVDLWAIFWMPENDTGWHDHDTSAGSVHVVRGVLSERALRIGGDHQHRHYGAGTSFSFGPAHIHRLTCAEPRSVSIHAYSPPLWRMGQYSVSADGVLNRVSVSYADELRPLEPAVVPDIAA